MEKSIVKKNFIHYVDGLIYNHKISHAYLFEVDNYEDDLIYIYDFIKMILCDSSYKNIKSSNNSIIHLIDHNSFPDIVVIEPDGQWIKKNQLLDLQNEFSNKSLMGNKRFYIIKNAEKLNASSANTILKFLEEPEEDIIAILLSNNRYQIIETILSRCQILSLKESHLNFNQDVESLTILDCVLHPNYYFIQSRFLIENILVDKNVLRRYLINVEQIIISYIHYLHHIYQEFDSIILNYFKNIDENNLLSILSILEDEMPNLDFNVNYKLWLDSLFSKFVVGG